VTRTWLPNGEVRLAAVKPLARNRRPSAIRSGAVEAGDPHIGRLVGWTVSAALGWMAHERGDPYHEDPNRTQARSVLALET
jgi:hypothetical protein